MTTTTDADADVNAGCSSNSLACILLNKSPFPFLVQSLSPVLAIPSTESCSSLSQSLAAPLLHAISLFSTAFHFFLPRFPPSDTRTELVQTEEEDGLVDLEAQNLGLDKAQGLAVDLDEALALLAVCDSSGGLLLAEALDRLNGRHFVRMCDEEVCRRVVRAGVVGRLVVVRFEMRFRPLISFRHPHFVRQAVSRLVPPWTFWPAAASDQGTHRPPLLCDCNNNPSTFYNQRNAHMAESRARSNMSGLAKTQCISAHVRRRRNHRLSRT